MCEFQCKKYSVREKQTVLKKEFATGGFEHSGEVCSFAASDRIQTACVCSTMHTCLSSAFFYLDFSTRPFKNHSQRGLLGSFSGQMCGCAGLVGRFPVL